MEERAVRGKKTIAGARGRTRSIAFVGLTIALMGVSAWVAIPFGPVLLTLQMFALMFALLALKPREAVAAIAGYLALGAIGLPMFSGMRGGIGMLLGPTGGYLWGYLVGAVAALAVRAGLRRVMGGGKRAWAADLAACLAFIAATYACGCVQYAAVVGVDLAASLAVTIAPFAIPDLVKAVAAVACARAVTRAI
ncbi:biotin transporter BioY [Arabiibacter massiliensis]|uniref:biotin transporter BioY n=1 Tax=Arabiibacter massiliensis TaxID=1870985 RepID=UPI0009BC2879|nr:biotin transporter BioY [Arabiibacter massiliensis]